jgi:hypothetical protein
MLRVMCLLLGVLLLPRAAVAWEIDGLRSGMTIAEATKAVLAQGDTIDRRMELRERNDAYLLKVTSGWLSFCSDVLYAYRRFLPGGFEAFVLNTERETKRLGAPALQSIPLQLELVASWTVGQDLLTFAVSKEHGANNFTFSRGYEDSTVEQRCKAVTPTR